MTERKHVTSKEAASVARFAADVMGELDMPGWRILVMEDPADKDDVASINMVDGKHVAQLYLASDWMDRPMSERRETIIHEVLHILHDGLSRAFEDLEKHLAPAVWELADKTFRRQAELMVDHLAVWLNRSQSMNRLWDASRR